jgi:hypothetical protein
MMKQQVMIGDNGAPSPYRVTVEVTPYFPDRVKVTFGNSFSLSMNRTDAKVLRNLISLALGNLVSSASTSSTSSTSSTVDNMIDEMIGRKDS